MPTHDCARPRVSRTGTPLLSIMYTVPSAAMPVIEHHDAPAGLRHPGELARQALTLGIERLARLVLIEQREVVRVRPLGIDAHRILHGRRLRGTEEVSLAPLVLGLTGAALLTAAAVVVPLRAGVRRVETLEL